MIELTEKIKKKLQLVFFTKKIISGLRQDLSKKKGQLKWFINGF